MPVYQTQRQDNGALMQILMQLLASQGGDSGTQVQPNLTGRGEGEMGGLAETGRDVSEYGTVAEDLPTVKRQPQQIGGQSNKGNLGLLMSILKYIWA